MNPETPKFLESRGGNNIKLAFAAHLRNSTAVLAVWKAQVLHGEHPEIAGPNATEARLGTAFSIDENQCLAKVTLTEAAGTRVLDTITAEMLAGHKDLKVPFDAFVRSGAELVIAWKRNLTAEQHLNLARFAANNLRLGIALSMPGDEWIAEIVMIDTADIGRTLDTIKLTVDGSKLN